MELKVIAAGQSHYSTSSLGRCHAVAGRARSIPQEYAAKARRLDSEYGGVSQDDTGPIAQKLSSCGRIWSLAFGAYGEASPDVHELVRVLAKTHASNHWVRLGSRDPDEAAAALSRALYRSWGLMAMRGQARLKLAGLSHVGVGAAAACSRRLGSDAFHASRREAYQLHYAALRQTPKRSR